MRFLILLTGLLCLTTAASAEEKDRQTASGPAAQLKAVTAEYEAAAQAADQAYRRAGTKEEKEAALHHAGRDRFQFAQKFLDVARANPRTSTAEDALIWIATNASVSPAGEEARRILTSDHVRSANLAATFGPQSSLAFTRSVESLLRKALAENPHPGVQGMAAFHLGLVLKARAAGARSPVKPDDLPQERLQVFDRIYGPGWKDVFLHADAGALEREAESLFIRVDKEYGDLPNTGRRKEKQPLLRDLAAPYVREMQTLGIGKTAPDVEGVDLDGKPFRLADYRGKVVMIEFGSHFFCGRCRDLYPYQKEAVKKYEGEPFALISIETGRDENPKQNREALKKIRAAEGLNWRCVWDGSGLGPINTAWNVRTYPTTYLIDQAGVIRFRGVPGPKLDELIARLLAESQDGGAAKQGARPNAPVRRFLGDAG